MNIETAPVIELQSLDIKRLYERDTPEFISQFEGGNVPILISLDSDDDFTNNIAHTVIRDADTEAISEALVQAVDNHRSDHTENTIEEIVAVLNENFGTRQPRDEFMLDNKFSSKDKLDEDIKVEKTEPDESLLDSFDPDDNVKQESAAIIAKYCSVPENEALAAADSLRQNGLLVENESN